MRRCAALDALREHVPEEVIESARSSSLAEVTAMLRDEHGLSLYTDSTGGFDTYAIAWWKRPSTHRTVLPVAADFHWLPAPLHDSLRSLLSAEVRLVYQWPTTGDGSAPWVVMDVSTEALVSLGLAYETPGTPVLIADRSGEHWLLPSPGGQLTAVLTDVPLAARSERMVTPWQVPLLELEVPGSILDLDLEPAAWFDPSPHRLRYDDGSRTCLAAALETVRWSLQRAYREGDPSTSALEDRIYATLRALAESEDEVEFEVAPPLDAPAADPRIRNLRDVVLSALLRWHDLHRDVWSGPEDADNQLAELAEQWHRDLSR